MGPPPLPKYYYDTSDGKCKLDSPSRPSWLLDTQNYTDIQLCCLDNSWNIDGCLADFGSFETAVDDSENGDNNSDGTIEYYYDTSDGKCKLDSPSRPSWLRSTQNYRDVKLCCNDNSWNIELCLLHANASTNDGSINPNGANLNDNDNDISPSATSEVDNSIPPTIINLSLQGTLQLHLPLITSIYQLSSSTLKIVLTKTFIQILQSRECSKWIIMNYEFEIDLVSIAGNSFSWRRQRRKMLVANSDSDSDRESHNRQLSTGYELIFQMTVPSKCNSLCQQQQQDDNIALGSISPYNEIKTCFGNSISSGSFGSVFDEISTSMNLFGAQQEEETSQAASISDGQLTYHYAKQSSSIYTWSPSKSPTDIPTVITQSPTTSNAPTNMYYPDIDNIVCLSLSTSTNQQINVFSSIETCCNFDWMDPATNYDTCISNSQFVASGQTKGPSRQPTQRPTRLPVVDMIYYIDLSLGVCKATSADDNNNNSEQQGGITFDTPQECCSHEYITSYDKCISYINTYHSNIDTSNCIWHPNPSNFGYCTYSESYPQSWDTIPDIMLYNTHASCCLGVFDTMDCYQEYNCNGMKSGPTPTGYVTEAPSTYIPTWSPVNADGSIPEPTSPNQDDSPSLPQAPSYPTSNQDVSDNSKVLNATSITTEISDSFENGILGEWPWLTSTSNPWTIYQDDKTDGSYSVRSATNLSPGETSDLYISINSINGGTLTFDLKSDVKMPYTGCYINIDDESKGGYTYPKSEWDIDKSIPVGSGGVHVVMFRTWAPNYSHGGESGVSGTITLDNVRFMPNLN